MNNIPKPMPYPLVLYGLKQNVNKAIETDNQKLGRNLATQMESHIQRLREKFGTNPRGEERTKYLKDKKAKEALASDKGSQTSKESKEELTVTQFFRDKPDRTTEQAALYFSVMWNCKFGQTELDAIEGIRQQVLREEL